MGEVDRNGSSNGPAAVNGVEAEAESVAILDAGAQYGKVRDPCRCIQFYNNIFNSKCNISEKHVVHMSCHSCQN